MLKKLYEKSESSFSVLWILIYLAGNIILGNVFGDSAGLPLLIFNVILSVIICLWISRNKLSEYYGFCKVKGSYKSFLYFIPLIILATVSLWGGINIDFSAPALVSGLYVAVAGFFEEVVFRGLLFKGMLKENGLKPAFIVSSLTFGFGHILNLLTGKDILSTLIQIAFATAFGFMVTAVFYKGKSLIPCILIHMFNNFSNHCLGAEGSTLLNTIAIVIFIVVSISYTAFIMKRNAEE